MVEPLRLRRFRGTTDSWERALVVEFGGYRGATGLVFFAFRPQHCLVEWRRLTTFPPNWHALSDESLAALFSDVAPVRPAVRTAVAAPPAGDRPTVKVAPVSAAELESANLALKMAHQQLDALAVALAACEAELELTRDELATLNVEIQAIYDRAARSPGADPILSPGHDAFHTAPND